MDPRTRTSSLDPVPWSRNMARRRERRFALRGWLHFSLTLVSGTERPDNFVRILVSWIFPGRKGEKLFFGDGGGGNNMKKGKGRFEWKAKDSTSDEPRALTPEVEELELEMRRVRKFVRKLTENRKGQRVT